MDIDISAAHMLKLMKSKNIEEDIIDLLPSLIKEDGKLMFATKDQMLNQLSGDKLKHAINAIILNMQDSESIQKQINNEIEAFSKIQEIHDIRQKTYEIHRDTALKDNNIESANKYLFLIEKAIKNSQNLFESHVAKIEELEKVLLKKKS